MGMGISAGMVGYVNVYGIVKYILIEMSALHNTEIDLISSIVISVSDLN